MVKKQAHLSDCADGGPGKTWTSDPALIKRVL